MCSEILSQVRQLHISIKTVVTYVYLILKRHTILLLMWHPSSTYEFFSSILLIWKYLFLPGFLFDKTNVQFLYKETKLWVFGFCLFGTLTVFFIVQRIFISYTHFILSIQVGAVGILNIFIIYSIFRHRYTLVELFNKFIIIEGVIKSLTKSCICYDSIVRFVKILLIERFVSAIIAAALDIESETLFKVHVVFYHFSENYQFCIELLLYVCYLLLRKFYALLDEFLMKQPKSLFKIEKTVTLLDEIFDTISMTFRGIILAKTMIQVFVLTVSFYYDVLTINYVEFLLTAVFCLNNEVQVTCSIIIFVQIVSSQKKKLAETLDLSYSNFRKNRKHIYKKVW